MAEMLGNRILPESVVARRRRLRERVNNLRRPVKQFRQENIPGPDVIGEVESSVADLRNRFVRRDSVLQKMRERRNGGGGGGSSSGSGGDDSGSEPQRPGRPDRSESAV